VADHTATPGRMPDGAPWHILGHSTPRGVSGRRGMAIVAMVVTAMVSAACTGGSPDPTTPVASASGHPSMSTDGQARASADGRATPPSADLAAIRDVVDAINATAGGPVARQRSELESLAAPNQLAQQRACPVAHSTLAFQPAYRDLRRASRTDDPVTASASDSESATGTAYLLPAFITIYTGDRITGTDLTTLRLWVVAGHARTGALCVS